MTGSKTEPVTLPEFYLPPGHPPPTNITDGQKLLLPAVNNDRFIGAAPSLIISHKSIQVSNRTIISTLTIR